MTESQKFLRNEFESRRKRNPSFSLRAFARWLEVSPAQLSQMITGKRTVSRRTLNKVSSKLGLSPSEKKRLLTLDLVENDSSTKAPARLQLEEDRFRLIADWEHLAILSLSKTKGARPDPRWIGHRLGIPVERANQALLRLQRLGFLQLHPEFRQVGGSFEVVSKAGSDAIRKFHRQNLELAAEKLETVDVLKREFQTISVALDSALLPLLKMRIDEFLDECSGIAESRPGKDVYHLNVQLFPITKCKETL